MAIADHVPSEASLPTRFGDFRIAVFREKGTEVVAISHGGLRAAEPTLVRLHSECLTGDALGSLRCDCGEQLQLALETISRADSGMVLYLRHEGRGIGLYNKIRAYNLQDRGLDTVDANVALGLPIDARDYGAAAAVLKQLGIREIRLITNNPAKIEGLERHGISVVERVPVELPTNPVNARYMKVKAERMGHLLDDVLGTEMLPTPLRRPLVTVHYAQTIDGRIAARTGDAHWVSGERSLRLAHELRASHDAIMVGIGTVLADDPLLTTRLVQGPSPLRVIVDSSLRIPLDAKVLNDQTSQTIVATVIGAPVENERAITARGARVMRVVSDDRGGVDLERLLAQLRREGVGSLLIEGGRGIITSALRSRIVDRLTVCIAPKVIGEGIDAVGDLSIDRLRDAVTFARSRFISCGEDVVFYGEPVTAHAPEDA
ncbi:MAG TPA: GTP cyclohydrolase II [Candidatus Limnocylindrales bacterium]|nr:GTP cyclohydrolase II [Candidatus Limnocylindrales bacterium]